MKNKEINQVCRECGIAANVLACLKKYGMPPKKLAFDVSTVHEGVCDYCGEIKSVTSVRDFFYPNFGLLSKYITPKEEKRCEACKTNSPVGHISDWGPCPTPPEERPSHSASAVQVPPDLSWEEAEFESNKKLVIEFAEWYKEHVDDEFFGTNEMSKWWLVKLSHSKETAYDKGTMEASMVCNEKTIPQALETYK